MMNEDELGGKLSWSVNPSELADITGDFTAGWSEGLSTLGSFGNDIPQGWSVPGHELFLDREPRFAETLARDFVFLSSSADVAELRQQVFDRLAIRIADLDQSEVVEPYDLERDILNGAFDQRISMQNNLPRPADPRCRAVVAFIGERIGLPLGLDFPAALIGDIGKWAESGDFRLKHPWPLEMADQLDEVRKGFFPLTGTVFEYLDARAAGRPVFVTYLANRPIRPEHFRRDPATNLFTYSRDGVVLN